jgi:hypothetical protein
MSPLCLPKKILHRYVNEILEKIRPNISNLQHPLLDVLENLLQRKTFEEEWPEWHVDGISKGKRRILTLENIRNDEYTMDDILKKDQEIYEWWTAIT